MHDTIIPWVWSKKRVKSTSIIYNILNFPILDSLVGKKKLDFQNKNMSFFTLSFISTYPASFPYWNNIDFYKEKKNWFSMNNFYSKMLLYSFLIFSAQISYQNWWTNWKNSGQYEKWPRCKIDFRPQKCVG